MEKKKRSKISAIQMDNFRGFLGIVRMDRVLNAQIRGLCGVRKGLDKRIDDYSLVVWPCGEGGE